jgi:hypothetical protein
VTAEATLRAAVLKRIHEDYPRRTSGVLVFGRPAGPSTGPGHPDLFGVVVGRFIALEIKVLKGVVAPLQVQRIKDLRQAGAYAWVVRTPLEASKAVYQAKIGGRMPTQEDPIDFDDWFKTIAGEPAKDEPRSAFAETATHGDDVLLLPEEEPVAQEGGPTRPTIDDLQAARDAGLLGGNEPEPSPEAVAEMPEANNKGARRGKFARLAAPAVPSDEHILAAVERLEATIKAVGERVTIVYEGVNRVETLLRSRHTLLGEVAQEVIGMRQVLNSILTEVQMEDLVQPPMVSEPTPFDDVSVTDNGTDEPAEAPRRGRGRPRKA